MQTFASLFAIHLAAAIASGRTREDIAGALQVSPSLLSHWTSGARRPSAELLMRVCTVLGLGEWDARVLAERWGLDLAPIGAATGEAEGL